MSFLIVGHTHEDIDQLFSSAQTKFRTASVHTPVYVPLLELDLIRSLLLLCCLYFLTNIFFPLSQLDTFLRSAYREEGPTPSFHALEHVWDWKSWLSNHMHGLSGHAGPHVFHF